MSEMQKHRKRFVYVPELGRCVEVTGLQHAPAKAPGTAWRKHRSNATGCHPSQVETYRQYFKDKGVAGVEVTNDGDFLIRSRQANKNVARAQGLEVVSD